MIEINIANKQTDFLPQEEISLRLLWELDKPPSRVELRVVWNTDGKGTTDIGVADIVAFDEPGNSGDESLNITLPEAPYSFSGSILSLQWAIELIAFPSKESYRKEISISPASGKIILEDAEVD